MLSEQYKNKNIVSRKTLRENSKLSKISKRSLSILNYFMSDIFFTMTFVNVNDCTYAFIFLYFNYLKNKLKEVVKYLIFIIFCHATEVERP